MAFGDHVQTNTATVSDTQPTVTMGGAPVDGNLLVALVHLGGSQSPAAANGYTRETAVAGTGATRSFLYWKIASGESTTQTPCAAITSANWQTTVIEYDVDSMTVDEQSNLQSGSVTTIATPTVTPDSGVQRLVVCAVSSNASKTFTGADVNGSTTGVTARTATASTRFWDLIVTSTTGSYTGNISWTTGIVARAHIVIFAAGADEPRPRPITLRQAVTAASLR